MRCTQKHSKSGSGIFSTADLELVDDKEGKEEDADENVGGSTSFSLCRSFSRISNISRISGIGGAIHNIGSLCRLDSVHVSPGKVHIIRWEGIQKDL